MKKLSVFSEFEAKSSIRLSHTSSMVKEKRRF